MSIVLHNFGQKPAVLPKKNRRKETPTNTNFLEPPRPMQVRDEACGPDHGLPIGVQIDAIA
ncbi:MAG TPA: hypothetical protein D7H95_06760 [Candidatus Poseidoniales archaeon]|nr:MAG TPA: hypothetical protein D7H95_06760 [Candidatus Poseidoniales archaeon]